MKHKNKLLILTDDPAAYTALISGLEFDDLEFFAFREAENAGPYIEDCEIILGEPSRIAPVLDAARNVKWVQSTYAGIEALVTPPKRTDYILTGVKGIFGPLMSEYVFAYILAMERHLFETRENQERRRWQDMPYRSLTGTLIGICGLGSIGRHIALTARCFGMKVWGLKRSKEAVPGVDRVFTLSEIAEFLARPDYIVITLPQTPETFYLFDEEAFQAMSPSAVLINVGRGTLVSEDALIRALKEKRIRGAVLDVFEEEPLRKESPLWGLPELFITPHNSAYSFAQDIVNIFAENYRRFVAGQPLRYAVDFDRGY